MVVRYQLPGHAELHQSSPQKQLLSWGQEMVYNAISWNPDLLEIVDAHGSSAVAQVAPHYLPELSALFSFRTYLLRFKRRANKPRVPLSINAHPCSSMIRYPKNILKVFTMQSF